MGEMICPLCGNHVDKTVRYCSNCRVWLKDGPDNRAEVVEEACRNLLTDGGRKKALKGFLSSTKSNKKHLLPCPSCGNEMDIREAVRCGFNIEIVCAKCHCVSEYDPKAVYFALAMGVLMVAQPLFDLLSSHKTALSSWLLSLALLLAAIAAFGGGMTTRKLRIKRRGMTGSSVR